jgi:hypothetical protein
MGTDSFEQGMESMPGNRQNPFFIEQERFRGGRQEISPFLFGPSARETVPSPGSGPVRDAVGNRSAKPVVTRVGSRSDPWHLEVSIPVRDEKLT